MSIQNEFEQFNEVRNKKVKEYGKLKEKSEEYAILPENLKKFNDEIESLLLVEIELPDIKIKKEDLDNDAKVSPSFFINLDWLIE